MRTTSTLGKGLLLGGVVAFVLGFFVLFTPKSNAWMTAVAWVAGLVMMGVAVKVIATEEAEEESRRDFLMMQRMEKFRQAELQKKQSAGGENTPSPVQNSPSSPEPTHSLRGNPSPSPASRPGSSSTRPVPGETEEEKRERRRLQREEIRSRHQSG